MVEEQTKIKDGKTTKLLHQKVHKKAKDKIRHPIMKFKFE